MFAFCLITCSLEERQRAEKRHREEKGHQFTPKWFDLTEEITPTPWGDLEIYQYNGKYTEHRAALDGSSTSADADDVRLTEFNPWQYDNLSAEWGNSLVLVVFGKWWCLAELFWCDVDAICCLFACVHCIVSHMIILYQLYFSNLAMSIWYNDKSRVCLFSKKLVGWTSCTADLATQLNGKTNYQWPNMGW